MSTPRSACARGLILSSHIQRSCLCTPCLSLVLTVCTGVRCVCVCRCEFLTRPYGHVEIFDMMCTREVWGHANAHRHTHAHAHANRHIHTHTYHTGHHPHPPHMHLGPCISCMFLPHSTNSGSAQSCSDGARREVTKSSLLSVCTPHLCRRSGLLCLSRTHALKVQCLCVSFALQEMGPMISFLHRKLGVSVECAPSPSASPTYSDAGSASVIATSSDTMSEPHTE